jgi:hypothetical protein
MRAVLQKFFYPGSRSGHYQTTTSHRLFDDVRKAIAGGTRKEKKQLCALQFLKNLVMSNVTAKTNGIAKVKSCSKLLKPSLVGAFTENHEVRVWVDCCYAAECANDIVHPFLGDKTADGDNPMSSLLQLAGSKFFEINSLPANVDRLG